MDDDIKPELVRLAQTIVDHQGIDALTSYKNFSDACGCMGPAEGDILCPCAQGIALEENLITIVSVIDKEAGAKVMFQQLEKLRGIASEL